MYFSEVSMPWSFLSGIATGSVCTIMAIIIGSFLSVHLWRKRIER